MKTQSKDLNRLLCPMNLSSFNSSVRGPQLVSLPSHEDARGLLVVGEVERELPFVPRRFFVINEVPPLEKRGSHAHRVCHQLLICVSGSVRCYVHDGVSGFDYYLDSPSQALYLPPMTWGEQSEYSEDAVLICLASHTYDAEDYITNFDGFLRDVSQAT